MTTANQTILPAERYGVRTMSMGMLTGDDSPELEPLSLIARLAALVHPETPSKRS
jgi:hypothetical protein